MSDLVERLRDYRTRRLVDPEGMMEEAADEIELLEQRLELALGASRNPEDIAEMERLRKALRDIKDAAFNRASSEVAGNFDACAYNIAKAALEDDDESYS